MKSILLKAAHAVCLMLIALLIPVLIMIVAFALAGRLTVVIS